MKSLKKTNCSTLNACGLAIFFSNFYLHWFFSNLSFFERYPHKYSSEGIRVKQPCRKSYLFNSLTCPGACLDALSELSTYMYSSKPQSNIGSLWPEFQASA